MFRGCRGWDEDEGSGQRRRSVDQGGDCARRASDGPGTASTTAALRDRDGEDVGG